jgi:hypothetical protein
MSPLLQKKFKKNVGKCAKGNGDRVNRNFNNAVCRAKKEWQKEGDKAPWVWPEAFIEFIIHLPLHLQGKKDAYNHFLSHVALVAVA